MDKCAIKFHICNKVSVLVLKVTWDTLRSHDMSKYPKTNFHNLSFLVILYRLEGDIRQPA